jgi:hypothetical protein
MEMVKAGIRNGASIGLDWLHAKENKWKRTTPLKSIKNYCMILQTLKTIFKRDLNRLKQEIELYQNESLTIQKGITILPKPLFACRNLNTYMARLWKHHYARIENWIFIKDIPKWNWSKIEETSIVVDRSLDKLTERNY